QARKLGVKVGDTLTLSAPTPRGTNNTIDVRLAVVAANMGLLSSWNTFIPNETLRRLYQLNAETTGAVFVYLKDLRTLPQVEARVREALGKAGYTLMDKDPRAFFMKFETVNREGWTGQRLDVTTWEDETSFLQWVITALDWLTRVLIFVLLVIIALGIINTLWIAIRERTREIGTLRAVGMQRLRVLAMFLIEASVLGTAATAAGAVIGVAVCLGLNGLGLKLPAGAQVLLMSDTLHLAIVPLDVLRSVLLISLCTMLISLLPSFLAARLRPVTAMHHVG
ncbi:MAG TPA: FtsX-like permease family protein, partial [Myxococcaceae bacterium]|nr:FtsX-like permease family protein [Myxococcaceae bacterium]